MRVELPDGQWAEVAEVDELRSGDRKAVLRATNVEIHDGGVAFVGGAQDDDARDACLARVVRNWSFELPLPGADPESLDKLPIKQALALGEAIKPHMDLIFNRVDPSKRGTDPTSGSSS